MAKRSCLVVLVGSTTANRKWINYEIQKAYELNKGIVGVYVNKLKNRDSKQSVKGMNPFNYVFTNNGEKLSSYITCYDSAYTSSNYVYNDIGEKPPGLIEKAIFNKAPQ